MVQLSQLEQQFAHTLDEIRNGIQIMQYEEPIAVEVEPQQQTVEVDHNDAGQESN